MRGLSIVPFSTGDVVFKQGDLSDALYFMLGPAIDPDVDGQDDEYVLLTTETKEKGDEAEGGGGEESKQELPFIPSRKFFGEEGLVYRYFEQMICAARSDALSYRPRKSCIVLQE